MFISTPNGWDWFHRLCINSAPGWESWQFPSTANPYFPPSELEDARRDMPERKFRQEMLAEFLPDGGGVFRNVRGRSILAPAMEASGVVAFHDPARTVDYNAVAVFKYGGGMVRQLYADRWHEGTWELSLARLSALRGFRGDLYVDTSVKSSWADLGFLAQIQKAVGSQLHVQGFEFTNKNKQAMTDQFALMLETNSIELLNQDLCVGNIKEAVLAQVSELEAWRAEKLPSGNIRYSGPSGEHDDMAISCLTSAHIASEIMSAESVARIKSRFRGSLI